MDGNARRRYPSDLTDEQWAVLEPLVPAAKPGGRPRSANMREVLNTLFYLIRTGCQWDYLPHDLVPKNTAYEYFAKWRDDGTLKRMQDALRRTVRAAAGREEEPRVASVDSQSVKATEQGGEKGYDGAKKITGRKRHIAVDAMGLLLAVVVTGAGVDDAAAAPRVFEQLKRRQHPRLEVVHADSKYHNMELYRYLVRQRSIDWTINTIERPKDAKGFVLLPKRWVVERTFAWLGRCRRHSRDYEKRTDSSESMVTLSSMKLLLNRLQPSDPSRRFSYRDC